MRHLTEHENPIVYDPIKYTFPEGETFKHFDLEWIHYQGLKAGKVDDREILEKIKKDSAVFFYGMRGRGYGRCDIRVDRDGGVFFLEINTNCSVFNPPDEPGSADLILMNHPEGHIGFINRIMDAAVRNALSRQKNIK